MIGEFKIGIINGYQIIPSNDWEILLNLTREMDCDILVFGHSHKMQTMKYENKYFINPGSFTGAFTPFLKLFK